MNPEHREFLAAINEHPEDETLRHVYADWLEEHDMPEESDRQRRFVPAMKWIRDFAKRWNFEEAEYSYGRGYYDGDHRWIEDRDRGPNPNAVQELIDAAVSGEYITAMGIDLHSSDELREDHDLFWKNLEIVTGKRFEENHRENFTWSCSC